MMRGARPLLSSAQRLGLANRASPGRMPILSLRASFKPTPSPIIATLMLRTQFSSKVPLQPNKRDAEFEKKIAEKTLEVDPAHVSTDSSIRPILEQGQAPKGAKVDVGQGLKDDVETVKETFALRTVPRESYVLGLAGTLPYLGTSLSTVFLAWNLQTEWPSQSNILNSIVLSHDQAAHWLHLLEPIQVGYGAVIISFLGAIHWGLEYAEKAPSHSRTRFRYSMGVVAPMLAWPSVFMPVEWALITQFFAFTGLYLADSRATVRGWTPPWYGTYRFVLTAIVGAAIFISLVGRAKVGQGATHLSAPEIRERLGKDGHDKEEFHDWAREEEEEKERIKKAKEEEEKRRKKAEKEKKKAEKKADAKADAKTGDGEKN
ncbi:hypothetical protein B0H66DRAFT_384189 [Apodospora peruviana]|uniref:Mitochondrial inner membrane protein 1 n=1 Tax=Apodospora peruviana TaxID=516989 RepID=A0AAE0HUA8_9PEZI|nr:hypothetical protein B0H66DRAFT_384189 [Apodospora peruviana]